MEECGLAFVDGCTERRFRTFGFENSRLCVWYVVYKAAGLTTFTDIDRGVKRSLHRVVHVDIVGLYPIRGRMF